MIRLDDPSLNYIIITAHNPDKSDYENRLNKSKLEDSLFLRDFTIMEANGISNAYLAYKSCDNDVIRYDAIELMDMYKQKFAIVKYIGEAMAKRMDNEGLEQYLGIIPYSGSDSDHNFVIEDVGFSFRPQNRYRVPESKQELANNMIVEIKNNNNEWVERVIRDVDVEYERMYKLLIKYKKIRFAY